MSQHSLSPRDYLAHMLDAAGQIETYARGKSPRDFLADRLIQDGVFNFDNQWFRDRLFIWRSKKGNCFWREE